MPGLANSSSPFSVENKVVNAPVEKKKKFIGPLMVIDLLSEVV